MCYWFSLTAHWCIQERTTDNKIKEKQKCPCKEEHCDVISRFLEPVELSFCRTNTKKLLGGFNTIHYTTQFLVGISNDLQNDKLKQRNRRTTRVVSCKGVIQVVGCVHTRTHTHTHTPLYVGTYRWLNSRLFLGFWTRFKIGTWIFWNNYRINAYVSSRLPNWVSRGWI